MREKKEKLRLDRGVVIVESLVQTTVSQGSECVKLFCANIFVFIKKVSPFSVSPFTLSNLKVLIL